MTRRCKRNFGLTPEMHHSLTCSATGLRARNRVTSAVPSRDRRTAGLASFAFAGESRQGRLRPSVRSVCKGVKGKPAAPVLRTLDPLADSPFE